MKKLFVVLCAFWAMSTANIYADTTNADDPDLINTNIDENGKRLRYGYITNPWYSNWFISASAGVQTLVSGTDEYNQGFDFATARLTPAFEVNVGKWITPVLAVRLGFQGFSLQEKVPFDPGYHGQHYRINIDENGVSHFSSVYIHGDVIWNMVNSIFGYRANRFYNISPYAHAGYMHLSDPNEPLFTKVSRDREFSFGLGLYNTFRINGFLKAMLDLRWGNFSGRYHDAGMGGRVNHFTATAGLALDVDFERNYWKRALGLEKQRDDALRDAMDAIDALNTSKKENEELHYLLDELNRKAAQAVGEPDTVKVVEVVNTVSFRDRVAKADLVMYYQINVSRLNFSEEHHFNNYVTKALEEDPEHVFYLTGSADKGTGSLEANMRLSRERAEHIKNLLMTRFNVPEDHIIIKATIVSDKHEDGGLDRCVLIENN